MFFATVYTAAGPEGFHVSVGWNKMGMQTLYNGLFANIPCGGGCFQGSTGNQSVSQ